MSKKSRKAAESAKGAVLRTARAERGRVGNKKAAKRRRAPKARTEHN